MVLHDLTSPEVEALSREVVWILPTGAIEQHGAYLPCGTDSILATAFAEHLEQTFPDRCVLLPTVQVAFSPHQLPFPGTLTLRAETYLRVITETLTPLLDRGFRRFYVLNAHGGNSPANEIALRELKAKYPNALFADPEYFRLASADIADVSGGLLIGHADELETSLMLHLRPDLVRISNAVPDGLEPHPFVYALMLNADEKSVYGGEGHPERATAELGEQLFVRINQALATDFERFLGTITMRGRGLAN